MSKKDHLPSPIRDGLMRRNTVRLNGEITPESAAEVGERMLLLQLCSPERINLIIDSDGGSVEAALRLCDLMTYVLTAPVRGIAAGSCISAATLVMLHCAERLSTPHSQFVIHSGEYSHISIPVDHTTVESLEQLLREAKATEERVLGLYMSRLTPQAWKKKRPSEKERRAFVQELINRGDQQFDGWLPAHEAVRVGLVERIVTNKLDIFSE